MARTHNEFAVSATWQPADTRPPTQGTFESYQAMYDHFNEQLFAGRLPPVLLNLSRLRGAAGFFWQDRWQDQAGQARIPEISITPEGTARPPAEVASTLVHEMVHHEQHSFGESGKGGYHNRQWAAWMKRVGLQPVSFDQPGKETGYRCSHTIVADGAFAQAFAALPEKAMPWRAAGALRQAATPPVGPGGVTVRKRNKTAYECSCGNKLWGKPGLEVRCNECLEDYKEV